MNSGFSSPRFLGYPHACGTQVPGPVGVGRIVWRGVTALRKGGKKNGGVKEDARERGKRTVAGICEAAQGG